MKGRKFYLIEDLERSGGGFIRKKMMNSTVLTEQYSGTAYFGGKYAEILVSVGAAGLTSGTQIIGNADDTKEGRDRYTDLLRYLKEQEIQEKSGINPNLPATILVLFIQLLTIIKLTESLFVLSPLTSTANSAYIVLETIAVTLLSEIKGVILKKM